MLIDKNFYYNGVDCDYNSYTDCESSGCEDEGICRCSKIENERVTDVNVNKIVNTIYDEYFDDSESTKRNYKLNKILFGTDKELDIYTIDRILRKYKIWDENNWEINICNSYYGEEIESVVIEESFCKKIQNEIEKAFSIDELTKRVEYLLILEYGSILPSLENCKYEIVEVDKNDILFGSKNHRDKVGKKTLDHYSDKEYKGIRGVVLEKDGLLKLIDGYHRIHSTSGHKVKVIKAKESN